MKTSYWVAAASVVLLVVFALWCTSRSPMMPPITMPMEQTP